MTNRWYGKTVLKKWYLKYPRILIIFLIKPLIWWSCACVERQSRGAAKYPAKFIGKSGFYDNVIISLFFIKRWLWYHTNFCTSFFQNFQVSCGPMQGRFKSFVSSVEIIYSSSIYCYMSLIVKLLNITY